mmetsp:Transcript_3898/g.10812  ORF Transcript_3898/g.10812 Transcript_3898/m.10812 type:complete len:523 (-) Transcript_3898:98-1666(-)
MATETAEEQDAQDCNAAARKQLRSNTMESKDKRVAEYMRTLNGDWREGLWGWNALDDEDLHAKFLASLPPARQKIGYMLNTGWAEFGLSGVILFNALIAVIEADATADGDDAPTWINVVNAMLLTIYTFEIILRIFAYHFLYFRSFWNWVDVTVVGLDLTLSILRGLVGDVPNISVLRTVRLIRLARAYRVITLFPELHVMVMGLTGTVRTVCWGLVLLFGVLMVFALIAVQLIHPIAQKVQEWNGCDRCGRAYESVWEASLTIIQGILAGDAWGQAVLPIVDEENVTIVFFMFVLVTINLLVVNLILAVAVEKAQQAHENDQALVVKQKVKEKEEQHHKAQAELIRMCHSMDEDGSGCLTLQELLNGYDNDQYFANSLKAMDIEKDDLEMVFNILDKDGSGDIDYSEFVDQLHKLKTQDQHTLLIFILHHIKEVQNLTRNGVSRFKDKSPGAGTGQLLPKSNLGPLEATAVPNDGSEIARLVKEAQKVAAVQADLMSKIRSTYARIAAKRDMNGGEDYTSI